MAPTIQRKVLKFYREGKQHVDDYLAGVEHGDLKNLGALCSNWSAVVFALATLIALYALGLYRKGLMTTWKMFLSTTAIVALLFCLTVFGYVTGHCMKTMDALESRARGAGQNVGEPRVKVCGQCDAPFANQHTNPAGNRWICASCGMISRKPKLATKETLAGKAKTEECHARSSLDRSPATEAATKEAEERRQVAKQTKELRRRHAREVKEAREAADRADREEIARLVEEERSRKEAARAEEALERAAAEEEQRRLREEEEVAARAVKEEEEAVAKAEEEAERVSAERASREPTERRRVTSLTKIPAPRPVNVAVAHPPLPPSLPPHKQQQQQQRAAVPPAGVMTHAPTRPPPTPRSSDSAASPNTTLDFDPPLPPMRPMTGPSTPTSPAWGGAANGTNGSPHAPMSPHAGVSTSPTQSGGSPSSHPPPHGAPSGFWSGGALGGLGLGAAGIRGILDGDEEVAAGVGVVSGAPPPPPGPPPGYAGRAAGTTNAPATNAPPLPAGPPPTSAAKRTPPPGQPPLPPMPHPSQVAAAAAAEKGGNPRAFLASLELEAYAATFERERISLADISLLTESDLERLGLPLGPRRRILAALSGVNVSGGTAVGHVGQRTAGIVPPGAPSISPNPFRVPRSSSVDSDTFGDGGIAGLTPLPNVGISGSPGMGVPGISGWNGGGFGGGLFGGFAPTAVSAVSTVSMANNGHSRQRSQSSDMDALAMDSLENDLMALTGGLNLDDDDEETEVEPRGSSMEDESSAFTLPGTPPKPPSHPALDQLDAESLVALQTAEAADNNNNNKQHQQVDPPKPPSEMMVKAAARLRAAAAAGHQIPQEFFCCITCEVMVDPVIAWDGHTYERDPIARWLQEHSTSPMTGETLPDFTLRPNHSMRSQIISYGERLEASR